MAVFDPFYGSPQRRMDAYQQEQAALADPIWAYQAGMISQQDLERLVPAAPQLAASIATPTFHVAQRESTSALLVVGIAAVALTFLALAWRR